MVQLFDDDETKVTEDEKPVRFEDLKIKLKCQFSGSEAGEILKKEIAQLEANRKQNERSTHEMIIASRVNQEVA